MGEWEYKILKIGPSRAGIFVIRGVEWRLVMELNSSLIDSDVRVIGPLPAADIALAMGWERHPISVDPAPEPPAAVATSEPPAPPAYAHEFVPAGNTLVTVTTAPPKIKKKYSKPKGPHIKSIWTAHPRAVERLKELRNDGLTYGKISQRLTQEFGATFTDSMCSAKADRLGLPKIPKSSNKPNGEIKPAQDAKADHGEPIRDDGPPVAISAATADAGADPEAGTTAETAISVMDAAVEAHRNYRRDSVGFWPEKPTLFEAAGWYRKNGHTVYLISNPDGPGYTGVKLDLGPEMPIERFLAIVNEERQSQRLEPFGTAA